MAIVAVDPEGWAAANVVQNVVQVDSDAKDNHEAILEIEDWAAENGFARINENWLRQIHRGGQRVFRGVCYRLTEEEQQSSSSVCQTSTEALNELPATTPRSDLDR